MKNSGRTLSRTANSASFLCKQLISQLYIAPVFKVTGESCRITIVIIVFSTALSGYL